MRQDLSLVMHQVIRLHTNTRRCKPGCSMFIHISFLQYKPGWLAGGLAYCSLACSISIHISLLQHKPTTTTGEARKTDCQAYHASAGTCQAPGAQT